ncbi:hypothetical protein BUALT_Bualt19G0107300 [Buddleja alternifolia]|uniref:Stress enhanced protein 1 n=1 Tax=Buddleja alternifolia TaxID=168488 RepID=A0AAV6W757_9LAMI|nr:hypothetical protein BUALT_Bualt19G0107300 [Buddleja alternifolia]
MDSVAMMSSAASSLCCYASIRDVRVFSAARTDFGTRKLGTTFATGSPLLIQKPIHHRDIACNPKSVSVRCEQSSKEGSGLDVWLGRLAMTGFAAAISVEIATGKGLLENFGLPTPLPTVALAVTVLVGVLTAVFIFQSASEN